MKSTAFFLRKSKLKKVLSCDIIEAVIFCRLNLFKEIFMNIVCLDMEGVLVPEIWIAFANETKIHELKLTTRDEPDYDKLMKYRLDILKNII